MYTGVYNTFFFRFIPVLLYSFFFEYLIRV